jgi:hypothetical protein
MSTTTRRKTLPLKELCMLFVVAVALAVVPRAQPAPTRILDLGPITIANGTAILSGTLASQGAAAALTVNGTPLGLDVAGHFAGTVNLKGASSLELELTNLRRHQLLHYAIPLPSLLLVVGGVIPQDVLDPLQQAAVSLLTPVAGATGSPLTVAGSVADHTQLVSLTVNGADVLGAVGQGGSFTVHVPGTTKEVTLVATDSRGNSETIRSPVSSAQGIGATVSASQAVGLRISKVRYITKGVKRTHRLRMVITVRDSRGLLVRGAKINVQTTAKARRLKSRPKGKLSGGKGSATFVLRLRRSAFGKRLVMLTVAKTPQVKTRKSTSVRLPKMKH